MDEQAVRVAQMLVWVLAAFCAAAPLRWAIPAMGVLASINPSGPAFASATDLGMANVVRIVLLPTFLLWRIGIGSLYRMSWERVPRTWMLFGAYAILACAWTPYQLSGVKMIGYLYAYSVTFMLFSVAWKRGWLTANIVSALIATVLLLAVVQTFLLGNVYGTEARRFTAFTSPQGFAAFLLCSVSILVFRSRRTAFVWLSIVAGLCGILSSGSRYVFVGMIALVLIASVARLYKSGKGPSLPMLALRGAVGAVLAVALFAGVGKYLPESRAAQLVNAIAGQSSLTQDIGTFAWRLGVYEATLTELRGREPSVLVFGSGTSSGADLILAIDRNFHADTVSANRVLHNEFLRVMYEWGFVGMALFLAFLGSLFFRAGREALRSRSPEALAVLGILPALLSGLAIENLLAGAGGATGAGFTLVLACGFQPVETALRRGSRWRVARSSEQPEIGDGPARPTTDIRRRPLTVAV